MSGGLIDAEAEVDALTVRLTRRARMLAAAYLKSRAMAARTDGRSWRSASLLWPLFAKG